MTLTKPILKDLIRQVYDEAFQELINDENIELPAEPVSHEDPPDLISEETTVQQRNKIMDLLSTLSAEDRARLFRKFGYYTSKELLKQLNAIKRAEKGEL